MKLMNSAKTNGTPNMGGILIWIVVPAMVLLLVNVTPVIKVFLTGFLLYGLWGFIDVVIFTNGFKKNEKMRVWQESFGWRLFKLSFAMLMNIGIMLLLYKTGEFAGISFFHILGITATPALMILLGIIGQFAIYSAELTDGLDGLMMGIFTFINVALMIILAIQGQFEFLPILAIILGVQLVDLYFNIPPARFWNGGPGAMPLGFAVFFISVVTDNIVPYFIITSMTWFIMASSAIQIVSLRFFKKRVFKIAPIHHHLQANGWPQYKVTMRFWLFTIATCILGIYASLF
jgi:phospho-N-acetylmuramoyl-pentapeptide-transferase